MYFLPVIHKNTISISQGTLRFYKVLDNSLREVILMVLIAKLKFVHIYAGHGDVYIVHNTKKEFANGHTHIHNYNTAKYLAKLITHEQIPRDCKSIYLLESFIRLETNPKRIQRVQEQIKTLKKKKRRR